MKKLDDYISDNAIIYSICRIRAKYAKQRNKKHLLHLISNKPNLNYHIDTLSDEELELNKILPIRKKWKILKKENRYDYKNEKINSIDYNISSLLVTIDWYKKNQINEPFLINLLAFVNEIKGSINDPNYIIKQPTIYPKLKGKKKKNENICRPISIFSLKDKIIIGAINKYYTELFDEFFYEYALAFKASKTVDGRDFVPSHHDAIKEILKYKLGCNTNYLWVVESDMNKFYDSVCHTVIKKNFRRLLGKVKRKYSVSPDSRAENIFYKYLDSYNFPKVVLPVNEDQIYWEKCKIPDGKYGWVMKALINLKYFKKINNAKIGIPQGGALSGLIANIVLDYADKKVVKPYDKKLGYYRFCDDMILIHPNKNKCQKRVNAYTKALKKLKLVPHAFEKTLHNNSKSFWCKDVKSKGPYKWSSDHSSAFPWIGFVGYEIHFDGYLRVRKSSLKKELDKQKKVVMEIQKAIKEHRRPNIKNGTILESAAKKLIGMAIGRFNLWNMHKTDNEMCWSKGYSELQDNPHVRKQVKLLDRKRNNLLARLRKQVTKFDDSKIEATEEPKEIIHYGKPFSYYYHVIEKINQKREKDSTENAIP